MKKVLGWMILSVLIASCTREPADHLNEDETGIYITHRDSGVVFSSYATFGIADSVAVISNGQLVERVRTQFDADFINAFADQLSQRGFTRVPNTATPDLVITVSRIYNDYSGIISYTDYWGGFGGFWDPYFWGYPGYDYYFPTYIGVYTITEGAIAVDMFDLKNAAAHNNQMQHTWSGLVRGSGTFNTSRAGLHAKALLDQSTYIDR